MKSDPKELTAKLQEVAQRGDLHPSIVALAEAVLFLLGEREQEQAAAKGDDR